MKGIGALAGLVGMVMNRVMPDSNRTPIASKAAAFLAWWNIAGGAAKVVLSGGLSGFGNYDFVHYNTKC